MTALARRGPSVRELGLPLPPDRMRRWRAGRPLKRWRYVGVYLPDLMLCVGEAWVGPIPRRFWALIEPAGSLRGRTTTRRGGVRLAGSRVQVEAADVRIDLELTESEGVEIVSLDGGAYAWTRKQAPVEVRGSVAVGGRARRVDGDYAFIDDSAGYHARHTAWRWSAGLGRTTGGQRVAWNLVAGVHDSASDSERTVWVDGEPREVGPVRFADDLSEVAFAEGGALRLATTWAERRDYVNTLVIRNEYRQPFGTFEGELPGELRLAEGYGVMEDHDVRW